MAGCGEGAGWCGCWVSRVVITHVLGGVGRDSGRDPHATAASGPVELTACWGVGCWRAWSTGVAGRSRRAGPGRAAPRKRRSPRAAPPTPHPARCRAGCRGAGCGPDSGRRARSQPSTRCWYTQDGVPVGQVVGHVALFRSDGWVVPVPCRDHPASDEAASTARRVTVPCWRWRAWAWGPRCRGHGGERPDSTSRVFLWCQAITLLS